MNKNRYVERKALCDYDLCEGLFDKLNLTVQDMIPLRKVFLLVTDKGKKILKRCDMKFEDVQFIDEALNYIYASDKDVIRYCRNKDNEVITTYNGKKDHAEGVLSKDTAVDVINNRQLDQAPSQGKDEENPDKEVSDNGTAVKTGDYTNMWQYAFTAIAAFIVTASVFGLKEWKRKR